MREGRPELTDSQIADIRRKLADPEYMARARYCMADEVIHDMFRDDGSDEPHFQDTGKVPSRKTE